jgi:aminomethyltransferase
MRHTPLSEWHEKNGGKMVDFHGWALPLQFRGIIQEHLHTRGAVSLFDCSHMGEFLIQGAESIRLFDRLVFCDVLGLPVGRARYGSILNERGGIVDDVVVMRVAEDELLVSTNAVTQEKVANYIAANVPGACNASKTTAKIDVQGPMSGHAMRRLGLDAIDPLQYYTCCKTRWRDTPITISRAGYTGELGYECFVPNDLAEPLWDSLLEWEQVRPAGLGARDTLRLEMGYTLYGQDVDESRTTLEAGMGRFIHWGRDFVGRDALCLRGEKRDYPLRTGIRSKSRQAPRAGQEVQWKGEVVGVVTSGTYGPSVGCGIGMAYLPHQLAVPGMELMVGPRAIPVETAQLPFYRHGTCRC